MSSIFFFITITATTEIYTLSLHDALPISTLRRGGFREQGERERQRQAPERRGVRDHGVDVQALRSEEHTSELQSLRHLVCRLLLEKKKRHWYMTKESHRENYLAQPIQAML